MAAVAGGAISATGAVAASRPMPPCEERAAAADHAGIYLNMVWFGLRRSDGECGRPVRSTTGLGARRAGEEHCLMTRQRGVRVGGLVRGRHWEHGGTGNFPPRPAVHKSAARRASDPCCSAPRRRRSPTASRLLAADNVAPRSLTRLHPIHFQATNNMAEYEALLHGLRIAKKIRIKYIICCGDWDLVSQQVARTWNAINFAMAAYRDKVDEIAKCILGYKVKYVRRDDNTTADPVGSQFYLEISWNI
ncbi:hypothetical protein QYE76_001825 [Lolium multiflorum]|uniref:RNase H type-1 domain-containing protein n=1 Tax=Lolium multiflorum TaxID=4521 RepID=A0AAD8VXB1_LOLMU|nr:hypothetical protein QYE76_001825 [Lolium multiflorum]